MRTGGAIAGQLIEAGLLAIVRAGSSENLLEVARALHGGGVPVMEITLNTPGALGAIAAVRAALAALLCGEGLILTAGEVGAARGAGGRLNITAPLALVLATYCPGHAAPVA